MNNNYRYQLEKYRGRATRYNCPQCGRKQSFTKYIDTYNNNVYINDKVGKCNRLDKCGYHYTPKQYFEDNPWLKEDKCSFVLFHRENERTNTEHRTPPPPPPVGYIPEWVYNKCCECRTLSNHARWLVDKFGVDRTQFAKSKEIFFKTIG